MVSSGTKKRIAVYDENTNSWQEFIASGSTVPLMESGLVTSAPRTLKGPDEKRMGAVVPLFPTPLDDSGWVQAASIIKKHPAQDVFIVVDSDSVRVPGVEADARLKNWIRFLKTNGAKVLGKVDTHFGVEDYHAVTKPTIIKWKEHYPDVEGIYLANTGFDSLAAAVVTQFTKEEVGYRYVVGSVGTAHQLINTTPENSERLVRDSGLDITILYEGKNFPEPSLFAQGWMNKYPRSKMGIIITGVDADENVQKMQDWVMQLVGTYKAVGYVYVNSDSGARTNNPYMALSSMFDAQLKTMDQLARAEGNTRTFAFAIKTDTGAGGSVTESHVNIDLSSTSRMLAQDLEKDVNGVRKIYPDAKQNYQEWYFNERDPFRDPQLKDEEGSNLRRMQDGSDAWYIDGGKSKGQVRLAGWSKKGTYWENATEMTIYVKWLDDVKGKSTGKYLYQIYLRGGDHSTQKGRGSEASCYKFRVGTNGQCYLVKEIQHSPPGYTNNVAGRKITIPKGKTLKNMWLGLKLVVYNIQEKDDDGPVWVRCEGWVDSTCTTKDGKLDTSKQKWVKMAEHIDKGGWRCSSMKKPVPGPTVDYNSKTPKVRQPTEIISMPGGTADGNLGAYRTDNRATCFKYFCIRQIENPSHAD